MVDTEVDLVKKPINTYLDLTGFPKFPDDSPSLIKKYLTKELWSKLKNV